VVSETVNKTETIPPDPLANYIDELTDFHRAIVEDRDPAATGRDGSRAVQVTLAMIASAREKRTVRVAPLTV
jgi:predicted dehydrogenase